MPSLFLVFAYFILVSGMVGVLVSVPVVLTEDPRERDSSGSCREVPWRSLQDDPEEPLRGEGHQATPESPADVWEEVRRLTEDSRRLAREACDRAHPREEHRSAG